MKQKLWQKSTVLRSKWISGKFLHIVNVLILKKATVDLAIKVSALELTDDGKEATSQTL